MTKKLALLTAFLLAFNASASSSNTSSLVEDEQVPDWSRTFKLIHFTDYPPSQTRPTMYFSTAARNPEFMMFIKQDIHAIVRKKDGPVIFKKGEERFGLIPFQDCELTFQMSAEEFYVTLCNSFNVARF